MATFIVLANFTDQGIRDVKKAVDRHDAFRTMADEMGIAVKSVNYTVGRYDVVAILEGSDEAVTTALLKVGSQGNVRTETMRGIAVEEMKKIVNNLP